MPVELKHVTCTYSPGTFQEIRAVTDLSLKIQDGEFVAVMGRTGSGKSTLIQLVAGLLEPDSGQVLLDGLDIHARGYDRSALRRRVGIVFQYPEYQLFETTVEKDVAFGLKHSGLKPEEISLRVRLALERMGFSFEEIRKESPLCLSGGEKRRVAIAGILAAHPGILILDEPVAGLDPLARREFLEMIRQFQEEGMTVIMVSHNADAVAEYAGRVLVMAEGRLEMDGDTRTVMSDLQRLRSLHLDTSAAGQAAELLRQRGVEIPDQTVRYDELLGALTEMMVKS